MKHLNKMVKLIYKACCPIICLTFLIITPWRGNRKGICILHDLTGRTTHAACNSSYRENPPLESDVHFNPNNPRDFVLIASVIYSATIQQMRNVPYIGHSQTV